MTLFDGTTPCAVPDESTRRREEQRMLIAQFGDGYYQRTLDGINTLDVTWSVTFENRPVLDIEEMREYLESRKGFAFPFADPATGEEANVTCDRWDINWNFKRTSGQRYGTLSAEFKKANGLTVIFPPEIEVAFDPSDLWSHGETGFLFNFAKTDRTFQDIQGQTSAGTLDAPVGMHFDEKNWISGSTLTYTLSAQPERIVNGTFLTDTTWVKGTGWTIAGDGVATFLDTALTLTQNVAPTNEMVRVVFDMPTLTLGNMRPTVSGEVGITRSLPGTYSQYMLATATGFNFSGTVPSSGTIDNVSMKRVPGSHCRQITAVQRPLRKTGFIRFDTVDDNLLLVPTIAPSTAYSILVQGIMPSAAVNRYMMGARADAFTHAGLFVQATTGFLCGITGETQITSDVNVLGVKGVACLVAQAGVQTLYWNGVAAAANEYIGGPTTTVAYRIGALNNNGAVTGFQSGMDMYKCAAINRALTPTEVASFSSWMAKTT